MSLGFSDKWVTPVDVLKSWENFWGWKWKVYEIAKLQG